MQNKKQVATTEVLIRSNKTRWLGDHETNGEQQMTSTQPFNNSNWKWDGQYNLKQRQ